MVRKRWVKASGLVASVGIGVLVFALGTRIPMDAVRYAKGNEELGVPLAEFLPQRVAVYAAALVLVTTFLAWVPRREFRWSTLGERTIYAYLLHMFVIRIADDRWDLYRFDSLHNIIGATVVSLLAVAFALLLMTAPVSRVFRWVVEPKVPWLFQAVEAPEVKREPRTAVRLDTHRSMAEASARGLLSPVPVQRSRWSEPMKI